MENVNSNIKCYRICVRVILIVVQITLSLSLFSCKDTVKEREIVIYQGINQAYVMINASKSDYILAMNKAYEESYSQVATLFKAASIMEDVHKIGIVNAFNEFSRETSEKLKEKYSLSQFDTIQNIKKYYDGQPLSFLLDSTKINLNNLIDLQSYMINNVFLMLKEVAHNTGAPYMSKLYYMYLESEQSAYRLFSDAYKNFSDYSSFTNKYWVCPLCGSIYIYGDGISECAVCGIDVNKFIIVN